MIYSIRKKKKNLFLFLLPLFFILSLTLISATTEFGYNNLAKPTLSKTVVNYTTIMVNSSDYWDDLDTPMDFGEVYATGDLGVEGNLSIIGEFKGSGGLNITVDDPRNIAPFLVVNNNSEGKAVFNVINDVGGALSFGSVGSVFTPDPVNLGGLQYLSATDKLVLMGDGSQSSGGKSGIEFRAGGYLASQTRMNLTSTGLEILNQLNVLDGAQITGTPTDLSVGPALDMGYWGGNYMWISALDRGTTINYPLRLIGSTFSIQTNDNAGDNDIRFVIAENGEVFIEKNVYMHNALKINGTITSNTAGAFSIMNSTGSAVNPIYSFKGDLNTGMYQGSNNEIAFSAGGGEALSIDNLSGIMNAKMPSAGTTLAIGFDDVATEVLHVKRDSASGSYFRMDAFNGASGIQTYALNGGIDTPANTEEGDFIGLWSMRGYGDGYQNGARAYMGGRADGDWTGSSNPTSLYFGTTPVGSTTAVRAMDILSNLNSVFFADVNVTNNLYVEGNITGNLYYGDIWFNNETSTGRITDLPVQDQWENVTGFEQIGGDGGQYLNGFRTDNVNELIATHTGMYRYAYSISFERASGGVSREYETALLHNSVISNKTISHRTAGTANDVGDADQQGLIPLVAGDKLILQIRNQGGTEGVGIHNSQLNFERIGA